MALSLNLHPYARDVGSAIYAWMIGALKQLEAGRKAEDRLLRLAHVHATVLCLHLSRDKEMLKSVIGKFREKYGAGDVKKY